jgi:hypothetical protein
MNTSKLIDKAATDYADFLRAGASYGASMQTLAKALGGTPCPTALERLAAVHAAKYKCNFTWNKSGDAVFYDGNESTRETRNDAARKSWGRNVMVWFTPERGAKPKQSHRYSAAHRQAAKAFFTMFEGKDEAAQIKAAIAMLRAIAK